MNVSGFHLTYCSNIHRGHTWSEIDRTLRSALPAIRDQLEATGPFAIGLRLSADAASDLQQHGHLAEFQTFLENGNFYVPTINGFPYGAFHGTRVKELVYRPDWREPARLAYTNQLSDILATLLSGRDVDGSVSTVPGAFRTEVHTEDEAATIALNMLRHAAHLVVLRERTGVTVTLAIEPEPSCFIETTAELVTFFGRHLLDRALMQVVSRETGVSLDSDAVRRHIGACLDTCHMAVEFEDPAAAFHALEDAGLQVFKIQVSSALDLPQQRPSQLQAALTPFSEDTYLHQVVARTSAGDVRYADLPEALTAAATAGREISEDWRVHFHVPVFLRAMNGLGTTQDYVATVLRLLKQAPVCHMLEVETYTWDVLPPEYRNVDQCTAIARELSWVRAQLNA
jgi:sugar phosphate isomerase/epimerase